MDPKSDIFNPPKMITLPKKVTISPQFVTIYQKIKIHLKSYSFNPQKKVINFPQQATISPQFVKNFPQIKGGHQILLCGF